MDQVWDEATKTRWYLHPYYDTFLSEEFVHLIITPDIEAGYAIPLLSFSFQWPGAKPEQIRTCQEHFHRLGINDHLLNDHYPSKLRALHQKTRNSIASGQIVTAEGLKVEIAEEMQSDSAEHGINCWESILNRGIIANADFLQFLVTNPREPSKPLREEPDLAAQAGDAVHPCG